MMTAALRAASSGQIFNKHCGHGEFGSGELAVPSVVHDRVGMMATAVTGSGRTARRVVDTKVLRGHDNPTTLQARVRCMVAYRAHAGCVLVDATMVCLCLSCEAGHNLLLFLPHMPGGSGMLHMLRLTGGCCMDCTNEPGLGQQQGKGNHGRTCTYLWAEQVSWQQQPKQHTDDIAASIATGVPELHAGQCALHLVATTKVHMPFSNHPA